MSEKFIKRWKKEEVKTPLYEKIKEAVRPPVPLKRRLNLAMKRVELHIRKLEKATNVFSNRDKSLFAKTVRACSKRDMVRANVLASELAEMRKMEKMIMHARLALEQIVLRLKTVSELGDVVSMLAPTVGVLRNVRGGLASVFPEAERELGQIGNLLSEIIIDAGQGIELDVDFKAANNEAEKILEKAAMVAEEKIKEELPEVPVEIPIVGEKVSTQT